MRSFENHLSIRTHSHVFIEGKVAPSVTCGLVGAQMETRSNDNERPGFQGRWNELEAVLQRKVVKASNES